MLRLAQEERNIGGTPHAVLVLQGDMDLASIVDLGEYCSTGQPVAVDVTGLGFVDTVGVKALLALQERFSPTSPITLVGGRTNAHVRRVLRASRTLNKFTLA